MTVTLEVDPSTDIDPKVLLEIYKTASKIKMYDDTYIMMLNTGKATGMYYSPRGQEIIPSAIAQVLTREDYVLTIYRGIHDQIAKGVPLRELTAEFFGRVGGTCKGKGGPMHVTHPEFRTDCYHRRRRFRAADRQRRGPFGPDARHRPGHGCELRGRCHEYRGLS